MKEIQGKLVCETLDEVLEPGQCALLVIDMQNDAVNPQGKIPLAGGDVSGMLRITAKCQQLITTARELDIFVVHARVITLDGGRSDSPSWLRTKGVSVNSTDFFLEDTWGAEFCPECQPLPGEPIITKRRSSAFLGTDLDLILRARGIKTVVVIGEQTPGCVEATYRDVAYHDYYNVLVEDCVAAFDQEQHDASILIQKRRHDVCDLADVQRIWRNARSGTALRAVG
jgi:nicotinamidase-related amidase